MPFRSLASFIISHANDFRWTEKDECTRPPQARARQADPLADPLIRPMTYVTAPARVRAYTHQCKTRLSEDVFMTIHATQTVREIAVELPAATRLFEKLGIDYCCGGAKPLTEACAKAGLQVEE